MKKLIAILSVAVALLASAATAAPAAEQVVADFINPYLLGKEAQVQDQGGSRFLVFACGHQETIIFSAGTRKKMTKVLANPASGESLMSVCPTQSDAVSRLIAACRRQAVAAATPPPPGGTGGNGWASVQLAPLPDYGWVGRNQANRDVAATQAIGGVAAAFTGGAWAAVGQRWHRPNRLNISQVGGGAVANATGGAVGDITNTAAGGNGYGYGGNTTITNPPRPDGNGGTPPPGGNRNDGDGGTPAGGGNTTGGGGRGDGQGGTGG